MKGYNLYDSELNEIIEKQATMKAIQQIENKISNFTLRDYFVGQVLAGMGEYLMINRDDLHSIAKSCYKIADALIEVRNEKK